MDMPDKIGAMEEGGKVGRVRQWKGRSELRDPHPAGKQAQTGKMPLCP